MRVINCARCGVNRTVMIKPIIVEQDERIDLKLEAKYKTLCLNCFLNMVGIDLRVITAREAKKMYKNIMKTARQY